MARQPQDPASEFGKLLSKEIRRELGDLRMSGRAFGKRIERSEGYVRARLNDTFDFTLTDIERFAKMIGKDPAAWVGSLEPSPIDVPGPAEDVSTRDEYDLAARKRAKDRGEDRT